MTTPFTDAGGQSLKKRLHNKRSAGLTKLAHELINQLNVISICRCKINEILACDPKKPTQDCAALEEAVKEVARLIEEITNTLSNPSCQKSVVLNHKPATNSLRIVK
jgi:hypothetical protein